MKSTLTQSNTNDSVDKSSPVVMQVLPSLVTGGVERGTVDVTQALTDAGWRAIVVSKGGPMAHEVSRAGGIHIELPIGRKNPLTAMWITHRLEELNESDGAIQMERGQLGRWQSGNQLAKKLNTLAGR